MAYPPAYPLLLARRLSDFLHSSLESLREHQPPPVLQTALLISPSGKLLAYDSPVPVSILRTQSTVAASLWSIHATSSPSVAAALGQESQSPPPVDGAPTSSSSSSKPIAAAPGRRTSSAPTSPFDDDANGSDHPDMRPSPAHDGSMPTCIAASFNGGAVFVVRRLQCGLLFACATAPPNSAYQQQHNYQSQQQLRGAMSDPFAAGPSRNTGDSSAVPPSPSTPAADDDMMQSSLLQKSASKLALHALPTVSSQRIPSASTTPAALPVRTVEPSSLSPRSKPAAVPAAAPPAPQASPKPTSIKPKGGAGGGRSQPSPSKSGADMAGSLAHAAGSVRTGGTAESYATAPMGVDGPGGDSRPADGSHAVHGGGGDGANDAASTTTTGTATTTAGEGADGGADGSGGGRVSVAATVAIARQQVEELARLLDDKFVSFHMPEDSLGINGFC